MNYQQGSSFVRHCTSSQVIAVCRVRSGFIRRDGLKALAAAQRRNSRDASGVNTTFSPVLSLVLVLQEMIVAISLRRGVGAAGPLLFEHLPVQPLTEREVIVLVQSWKAIQKQFVESGVTMFLRYAQLSISHRPARPDATKQFCRVTSGSVNQASPCYSQSSYDTIRYTLYPVKTILMSNAMTSTYVSRF